MQLKDKNGVEHWQKSDVDMDKHLIIPELLPSEAEDVNFPNKYIADLVVSSPLDRNRPLWEIHALQMNCGGTSCVFIFRIHHALGDGISIMSLFLASCRRVDRPDLLPTIPSGPTSLGIHVDKSSPFSFLIWLWKLFLLACFTFMDVIHFTIRIFCVRDSKSPISGGAGVELWPRKLAVATFTIDDMRAVKNAVNGTVNDVLLGIILSGFRRYLEIISREAANKDSFVKVEIISKSFLRMVKGDKDYFLLVLRIWARLEVKDPFVAAKIKESENMAKLFGKEPTISLKSTIGAFPPSSTYNVLGSSLSKLCKTPLLASNNELMAYICNLQVERKEPTLDWEGFKAALEKKFYAFPIQVDVQVHGRGQSMKYIDGLYQGLKIKMRFIKGIQILGESYCYALQMEEKMRITHKSSFN
eukprot:Gb_41483 [translate_table: standard]